MTTDLIKQTGKCCACEEPLASSNHLNIVQVNQPAGWEYPVWANKISGPDLLAVAFICDGCSNDIDSITIRFVVECINGKIKYHAVTSVPFTTEIKLDESVHLWEELSDKEQLLAANILALQIAYDPHELLHLLKIGCPKIIFGPDQKYCRMHHHSVHVMKMLTNQQLHTLPIKYIKL